MDQVALSAYYLVRQDLQEFQDFFAFPACPTESGVVISRFRPPVPHTGGTWGILDFCNVSYLVATGKPVGLILNFVERFEFIPRCPGMAGFPLRSNPGRRDLRTAPASSGEFKFKKI